MPKLSAIRKHALDEIMKEALYEATVAVLREQGADGMTMDRVASVAGMAKGSLYRYFRSKRDLLEFVHSKAVDPILQNLDEVLATEQPAIEKLARHLRSLLENIAKHGHFFALLFEDETAHRLLRLSHQRSFEAGRQRLAEIFRQGIAEGVVRPMDPLILAGMYLGHCKGVLDRRPNLDGRDQRESIHRLITDTFLNGVAREKGESIDEDDRQHQQPGKALSYGQLASDVGGHQ